MGRIAHIQLGCPHCGKRTDAYIQESKAARANIKCQHCGERFEFGPGMMYSPIGYVLTIPPSAELAEVME